MIRIAYSDIYKYALPDGHRFPMIKYELTAEQLLYEGIVDKEQFFTPAPIEAAVVKWTHSSQYWHALKEQTLSKKQIREIGFPMTPALIERSEVISQGTIDCIYHARKNGVSLNVAGGTHHAYRDKGGGFCLLNDFAIASHYLIRQEPSVQILIIDLDVHQGDGTAHIFKDTPQVFTFSMHGEKNYPHTKQKSDLDIALPDSTNDEDYLTILKKTLPQLIREHQPDHIFYLAGVDVIASDRLGRLSLSIEGCQLRDRFVLKTAKQHDIPISVSMGGGYSIYLRHIIDAHVNTFREAVEVFG